MYKQKPADLAFFKGKSLLGRLIRWFTRAPHEPKTFSSHIGGIVAVGVLLEALVKVTETLFNHENYVDIEIWRCKTLTEENIVDIVAQADKYYGRTYGFLKLLTHALDALIVKVIEKEVFFFRRLNHIDRYPICSWLWAFAYNRGLNGYEFGVKPEYATPDDMHDFVSNSDDWELVYKK